MYLVKFGAKSVFNELRTTFYNFLKKYKFSPGKSGGRLNPRVQYKCEGNYIIYLIVETPKTHKYLVVNLKLIEKQSNTPVLGFENLKIKFRHSFTEDDMAEAINNETKSMGVVLTTNDNIVEKPEEKQQQNTDSDININDNVIKTFGMEKEILLDRVNRIDAEKSEKINVLKLLRSGWEKLSPEEKKVFQQLL